MLTVTDLGVHFGERQLFKGITFAITNGEKIGLAGRNGIGKSTLLKIIYKEFNPNEGNITSPKDYQISYLPQELKITTEKTIFDEAKSALANLHELETEREVVSNAIIERTDYESQAYMDLIDKLNRIDIQLHASGSGNADQKVEEILKGLGFQPNDLHKPVKTFSGGWQMRVELAKILLAAPDLILLDEPTNHLDIESIIWLEGFLKDYEGSILMVSHDKQFLDNITNRTIEIVNANIEDYKAAYSRFLVLREERVEKQIQARKNQDKYKAQLQRNVEKFRAKKNKAKFAQTLIKKLDKMETIEVDSYDNSKMVVRFTEGVRTGNEVVKGKGISKFYGDKKVLEEIDIAVHRGERIAFVGQNGMGKTTLVRMILEEIDYAGKIELGYNVDIGYYAQHQNYELDGSLTLLETIEKEAPITWQGRERGLLGSLLFSGDDVDKKVKVLSGGEKARLALAKLIMKPVNLLIMDEPTNHLDMASKEVLKTALLNFAGTLLVVSHDRDFLTGLTDQVLEFKNHGIKQHLGDVNAFLESKKVDSFRDFEMAKNAKGKAKNNEKKGNTDYAEKKQLEKDKRKAQNKLNRIETSIQQKEQKIKETEVQLQDPAFYKTIENDASFFTAYDEIKKELKTLEADWETQVEIVENLVD